MKVLKKIWSWIKKNKCLTILIILAITLTSIFGMFVYNILVSSKEEQYFNRLNESLHVEFLSSDEEIIKETLEIESVNNIVFNVDGKLIKIFIYYIEETTAKNAISNVESSIEIIPSNIKEYYDFEYFLISDDEESESFPIIGGLHKTSDEVSWTTK